MLSFLTKTIKRYLLIVAFIIPIIAFISLIIETKSTLQSEQIVSNFKAEKSNSKDSTTNLEVLSSEFNDSTVISIDNFPVKKGRLSSRYGMRKDPFNGKRKMHTGIDIAAKRGTNINPLGYGKVVFSGKKAGYGNTVEILHGRTIITRYSHLKKALVKKGQSVSKGDIIAQVGNTGRSTGPHLHLEIIINGEKVDPQIFLVGKLASR